MSRSKTLKIATTAAVLALSAALAGCAAGEKQAEPLVFNVSTGDTVSISIDPEAGEGYTIDADGGTFIVSKDGQAITKGMFLAPSTYTQYIDAASTYPVFKHCRVRGNDGAYYVTSSSGSVEYFYIIALEGDKTCVILDTAVSEDAATDIAAALVFDVSQQTFEGSK